MVSFCELLLPRAVRATAYLLSVPSYNKTEEDFDTLDEYNDYLEMLENLGA